MTKSSDTYPAIIIYHINIVRTPQTAFNMENHGTNDIDVIQNRIDCIWRAAIASPEVQALLSIFLAASRRNWQVPVSRPRDRPSLWSLGLHEQARPLASPTAFGRGVRGSCASTLRDRVSGSTGSARGHRRIFIPAARLEADGALARHAAPAGFRDEAKNRATPARMVRSSSAQKSDLPALHCAVPDHHHALADG